MTEPTTTPQENPEARASATVEKLLILLAERGMEVKAKPPKYSLGTGTRVVLVHGIGAVPVILLQRQRSGYDRQKTWCVEVEGIYRARARSIPKRYFYEVKGTGEVDLVKVAGHVAYVLELCRQDREARRDEAADEEFRHEQCVALGEKYPGATRLLGLTKTQTGLGFRSSSLSPQDIELVLSAVEPALAARPTSPQEEE